jgi:hypothetical protein
VSTNLCLKVMNHINTDDNSFGLFLLLSRFPQASSLTFEPILGPFNTGEQVPIQWTLDDSEPADGWELWFGGEGSAFKLANIPPLVVSTAVPFPGRCAPTRMVFVPD